MLCLGGRQVQGPQLSILSSGSCQREGPHAGPQMCHLGPHAVLGSLSSQHRCHLFLLHELATKVPVPFCSVRP